MRSSSVISGLVASADPSPPSRTRNGGSSIAGNSSSGVSGSLRNFCSRMPSFIPCQWSTWARSTAAKTSLAAIN